MPNHYDIDVECSICGEYMYSIDPSYQGMLWTTCDNCRAKEIKMPKIKNIDKTPIVSYIMTGKEIEMELK